MKAGERQVTDLGALSFGTKQPLREVNLASLVFFPLSLQLPLRATRVEGLVDLSLESGVTHILCHPDGSQEAPCTRSPHASPHGSAARKRA